MTTGIATMSAITTATMTATMTATTTGVTVATVEDTPLVVARPVAVARPAVASAPRDSDTFAPLLTLEKPGKTSLKKNARQS
jgi:hypothetical protein